MWLKTSSRTPGCTDDPATMRPLVTRLRSLLDGTTIKEELEKLLQEPIGRVLAGRASSDGAAARAAGEP
jgi:hypothetical protein